MVGELTCGAGAGHAGGAAVAAGAAVLAHVVCAAGARLVLAVAAIPSSTTPGQGNTGNMVLAIHALINYFHIKLERVFNIHNFIN